MTYLGEGAALLTALCWSLNSVCQYESNAGTITSKTG